MDVFQCGAIVKERPCSIYPVILTDCELNAA